MTDKNEYYAVVRPDGEIFDRSIRDNEWLARFCATEWNSEPWEYFNARGYRVARVRVEVIDE